jgi:TonB family protein
MAQRIATRGMELARTREAADHRQSRRMLLALVLILVALGVTVLRDRQYLFGNGATSDQAQPVAASVASTTVAPPPATPVVTEPKPATVPAATAKARSTTAHATTPHKNRPVRSYHAEVIHQAAPAPAGVTEAGQRAQLPAAQAPQRSAVTNYPLLDASTRVQGSVVLQALIGADGVIQNLRVISGPAILGAAARQAVLQWRFKPYVENGRPVETQATVTVNFTIRVADNSNKTARSYTPDKVIILADNS